MRLLKVLGNSEMLLFEKRKREKRHVDLNSRAQGLLANI